MNKGIANDLVKQERMKFRHGKKKGTDKEHRNSMLGMFILAYARLDFT